MVDADPKVIARLNTKAEEILRVKAAIDERTATFKADEARLKSAFEADIQPLQERIHKLEQRVVQLVDDNHAVLFKQGKQSFATVAVKFKLLHWRSKRSSVDETKIMEAARHLNIVRQIADAPRVWTLNRGKLNKYLERNPMYRAVFAAHIVNEGDEHESLTLSPNNTHAVFHDKDRLSSSYTIKKS